MSIELANNPIDRELIQNAMSYPAYTALLDDLFEQGKTTGNNHSEAMLNYAKMNMQRMRRLHKTIQLSEELATALEDFGDNGKKTTWLVITEGWCGDAAQNLPLLHEMAKENENIDLKLILRDENLEVMDAFLTNGGRSIPKLIILDSESLEVLASWGPRPQPAQDILMRFKEDEDWDHDAFSKTVQLWYAKDKTLSMQKEMVSILKEL